jgi:hypothetical protein
MNITATFFFKKHIPIKKKIQEIKKSPNMGHQRQRTIEWWWRGEVFRKHTPSANGGSLNPES